MMNFQDDLLEALNEDSMDGLGVGRNSTTEEGTSLEDEEKNYNLINPSPLEHAIPAPKPQDIVRGDAADESFQTLVRDMINPDVTIAVTEELPVDDPKQRRPDISKARKLLGWAIGERF